MGCDIHCYVEYRPKGDDRWNAPCGRMNPGRDYTTFGKLAGVRTGDALVPPRGMPGDSSYYSRWDNICFVDHEKPVPVTDHDRLVTADLLEERGLFPEFCQQLRCGGDTEHRVSIAKAEEWVEKGYSEWDGEDRKWVTNPDWHSHSWLTLKEWEAATKGANIEYRAITGMMKALQDGGRNEVRIVFWFDN